MITSSQEYQEFLAEIANRVASPNGAGPSILKMRIPTYEPIYEINLNTRKITPPSFIGVEGDHEAEYIYFQVDRYFDGLDLADSVGLIVFKNAKDEEYYQIIPYYDTESIDKKIIFPWVIQAPAALYSGVVSFSIKFFKIDPTSKTLIYELNTTTAKTKVLSGWANSTGVDHTYNTLNPESITVDNIVVEKIATILEAAKNMNIYWIDVD